MASSASFLVFAYLFLVCGPLLVQRVTTLLRVCVGYSCGGGRVVARALVFDNTKRAKSGVEIGAESEVNVFLVAVPVMVKLMDQVGW